MKEDTIMEDYKPNSHRYKEANKETKEQERKVEKAVTGTATVRKKNEVSKLADVFISEDIKNVKSYVLMDVLVPTIKKAIVDIVTDGVNMIFFGGTGPRKSRPGGSKISYSNFYEQRDERRYSNAPAASSSSRFDYGDIEFETRGDADAVLDEMNNVIERYGFVTVADMYDIADITHPYTSAKYGWTNISTATISRCMNGKYIIKLPKARPIE